MTDIGPAYAVKYSDADGGDKFAWFIGKRDADLYAAWAGKREGMQFEVVAL